MRTFTLLVGLIFLTFNGVVAQAPNSGFYVNSVEKDVFKVPDSDVINKTQINNRTYETYFYANDTALRQFIFMEGNDKRGIMAYIEGGYIIVGAYNIDNDYTNLWTGTYFRKPITASTWYHVALVFDNAAAAPVGPPVTALNNTNLKWYLDGVLQDEKAGFQIGGSGNHNNLNIGFKDDKLFFPTVAATWIADGGEGSEYSFGEQINEDGGGENYFDGYLWGFRVWDTVRTAAEIDDNKTNLFLQTDDTNLLAVLDGDTVTYLDNNSLPDVRDSEGGLIVKEWEGITDSNWATATNWKNNLVPDNAKQEPVIIKKGKTFYPAINSTVVTGDIILEADGTTPGAITIQDGGTLDVAYDLVNDGDLVIEDNGSLQVRESNPIAGTGSVSISRDTPDYPGSDFYSVWSTPVSEANSQLNTIFTNSIITYEYDSSQNPMAYVQLPNTANMEVGRGYFIRSDSDAGVLTRTFSGTLNNGNIDLPIYYNSSTDLANLIGNPYASAINWKTFYEDNSDVLEGNMYFWKQSVTGPNNQSGDYKSYNVILGPADPLAGINEFIAAGMGVFVKSQPGGGTVTFKNSHQVTGNNSNFYRIDENEDDGKSWFRMSGSMGYSPILIGFIPGATDEYESMYDATFIGEGASIEFYSLLNTNKLEIQGRSVLEENQKIEIPLGFEVTSAGDYTVSIVMEYIDPTFEILLEDKLLDITTDLRLSDYTFNVPSPIEDHNRFTLHYNYDAQLSIGDFEANSESIRSFFLNNDLMTNVSVLEPQTIQVFDVLGKEVINSNFKKRISVQNIESGLYIVKYIFEDSKTVSKKVIKR